MILRGASNIHFPQILSVISIPDPGSALKDSVVAQWEHLKNLGSQEELVVILRVLSFLKSSFEGHEVDAIWMAIQEIRSGAKEQALRPVKEVEFEAFTRAQSVTHDVESPDFLIRPLDSIRWGRLSGTGLVKQIVLVDKLREVAAMVGFTRLAPASNEINGELNDKVEMARIHRDVAHWYPVREIRGEGFFLEFRREAIENWMERQATKERSSKLAEAFSHWSMNKNGAIQDPGPAYYMLHSLAHMLMTGIALECGYPSSSLKERIYCLDAGFGILIYTGSNDIDGTLGGLVQSGEDIERHLLQALQAAELCSNDPICAHHEPGDHDERPLQGAACHGCLFVPETSCEQRNEFLDRNLVVQTVDRKGCEFFTEDALRALGKLL